ncbi:UDP-glucose 6-dehydrogenase [Solibacillus sp. FSL K6-1554]|uniref:UDP-glucose 6-dehydrogenase n=1 Tax=Solibacillus sp. FSL K6-1554 TaxID=2921472 RepID=UPI0030FA3C62
MLQLFFNDDHLISITGDQEILSRVPENYKHFDLIKIRSELVTTEHLVEAFEFALRKSDTGAVHAAAYYAKLKNMYVQKKRALTNN